MDREEGELIFKVQEMLVKIYVSNLNTQLSIVTDRKWPSATEFTLSILEVIHSLHAGATTAAVSKLKKIFV
jgi:hypothetical protein